MNVIISARYICESRRFRYIAVNGSDATEVEEVFQIVFVARAPIEYNKIQPYWKFDLGYDWRIDGGDN